MATESEQVRMLRENELLKTEIDRLKAERDLARDQAASTAGDMEQAEADAYQLRRNVRTWQERWEREQAEVARLKANDQWHAHNWGLLWGDYQQAQTRVTALEESCQTMLSYLEYALGPGDGLYLAHDTQTLPAEIAKMKAALAAPAREGDADGDLKPEVEARLRESLKTPREDLLTSDEMRQKLEEADADRD